MILNERQYRITKTRLSEFREAIRAYDMQKATALIGDKLIAEAQLHALESEHAVLSDQLREYESLKAGTVERLEVHSLAELPNLLIMARIASGLSQRELAERLGLKEQQIQRYEAEGYTSASLRRLIEISNALGLKISERARIEVRNSEVKPTTEDSNLDWDRFPLKEMYRRGWFRGFYGSLHEAEANSIELLTAFFGQFAGQGLEALHRKHVRTDSTLDEYCLLAWQCRVLNRAREERLAVSFKRSCMTAKWMQKLAKLSVQETGPVLAKEYLRESGITLILEPHLPQTYLDGAALLLTGERPVIGMTLRYDRLDNFWFVLFHELAHLVLHLGKAGIDRFFDDLEGKADEVEREADEFATEHLIPNEIWETSVAKYDRSPESIKDLAEELGISSAIVAGRIRKESANYLILNELIGAGQVRRQFGEVKFGR